MRLVLIISLALFTHSARAASQNFSEMMTGLLCTSEMKRKVGPKLQVQSWFWKKISVPGFPLLDAITFRDTRVGKVFFIWQQGKISILSEGDLSTRQQTLHSWDPAKACKSSKATRPLVLEELPTTQGFSDQNLNETMKAHEWGLIYLWSPSMPMSLEALKEIKQAAKTKSAHLTVLVDPLASDTEINKSVANGFADAADTTRVASHELLARDISAWYPSLLIYKNGFLSNRTLIGHKTAADFVKWIEVEIVRLQRDMQ